MLSDISHFGAMVLVALPEDKLGFPQDIEWTYNEAEQIQNSLFNKHKIEVSGSIKIND